MRSKITGVLVAILALWNIAAAQTNTPPQTQATTKIDAAAQARVDSQIVHRHLNDTLGFISYGSITLPDSVVVNRSIACWELNMMDGGRPGCTNYYRSCKKEGLSRHAVMSTTEKGFGMVCPPGWCVWYISAKKQNGDTITINDYRGMNDFIGAADNSFNALFWLDCFTKFESGVLPLTTYPSSTYKPAGDGFLIRTWFRISDCPVTSAELLYYVGKDKKVVLIQQLSKTVGAGCI